MPNPANAMTGDIKLTAQCRPDPVTRHATHDVTVENSGSDRYYLGEIQIHVIQGGPGSGLLLDHGSRSGYLLTLKKLGTFGQWSSGSWTVSAQRQQSLSQNETIRTTVLFDRSAALDPLDPDPAMSHCCDCDVDVAIQ
jgi:hypothetical protein